MMKKPFVKIFIILFITFIISEAAYLVFSKGLNKYNNHKTERLQEIFINNTYYDLIFLGSSRTHISINPAVVDSITGLNSYNIGVEGGNLLEFKMTLDGYLVNHPSPKYLILTLDLVSFDLNRKFFNHTQYFPYLKNQVLKTSLDTNGHNTFFLNIIPLLELTDYDDYSRNNSIRGILGQRETGSETQYKGYLTNGTGTMADNIVVNSKADSVKINKEALSCLQSIIDTCKSKNIKLVFTYAPEYKQRIQQVTLNSKDIFNLILGYSQKNNIPFLRYDTKNISQHPEWFANTLHVNRIGADEYSKLVGLDLNEIRNSK